MASAIGNTCQLAKSAPVSLSQSAATDAVTLSRSQFLPRSVYGRVNSLSRGVAELKTSKGLKYEAVSAQRATPTVCAVATEVVAVDYVKLNEELQNASPFAIMNKALEMFGDDIAIAFSGAEDVALIEYAKLTGRPFRVFSLDTGRLNAETYQFFDKVEKHYGIHIEYMFPDGPAVENLVRTKGMFSFYEDGHQECCGVRKVQPLKRALRGLRAWITGQRKDQSPGTRANVPAAQIDPAFEGLEGGKGSLVKFNPLANVSSLEVWDFLRTMEVPTNELHAKGFISIGCEPCTKAVLPNQHEREGRWWWEDATAKECGLHKAPSEPGEETAAADLGYNSSVDKQGTAVKDIFEHPAVVNLSRADIEKLALSDEPREASWLVVLYAPWCPYCQAMEAAYHEVAETLAGSGVRVGKFQADKDQKEFAKAQLQLKSFPTIHFLPKGSTTIIKRASERRDAFSLLTWVNALK